jgi:hypothetical protein
MPEIDDLDQFLSTNTENMNIDSKTNGGRLKKNPRKPNAPETNTDKGIYYYYFIINS